MTQPPENYNQIAYVNIRGQLCLIAPTGENYRLLTASRRRRRFRFPTWSPDSTHLAAIGLAQGSAGVFVLPVSRAPESETDVPRALHVCSEERPFYLYWSPNSQSISFVAAHPQGLGLHLINSQGSEHRLLTTGQPCFWDWAPTGNEVLIHTGGNGSGGRVGFIDVHSASKDESGARPGLFQVPVISPGGVYWASVTEDEDGSMQLLISHRSNAVTQAVSLRGAAAFSWSPGQDLLAYIGPVQPARHFYGPLRLLNIADHTIHTLASETVMAFFWSPDGRQIAYLALANEFAPLKPAAARANGNGTRTNGHTAPHRPATPTHQGDLVLNLWVVDVASGQRRMLFTFRPCEEYITQFLPFFDQYALSHRIWSPASDALVLPAVEDGRVVVTVVPADGSEPRTITEGNMPFWSPL